MKKNTVSPNQLGLVMIVLINVIIIRDGSLLDDRLYFFLIGTIPLLFYLIFNSRRRTL
jgi:hypothetical protein